MLNPEDQRFQSDSFPAPPREQIVLMQTLNQSFPPPSAMNTYQQYLQRLLDKQNARDATKQAARFLPWMEHFPNARLILKSQLPFSIWELLNGWHELFQLTVIPTAGTVQAGDARSLKLRRLMRQAYLNLELVILTISDHGARSDAGLPACEKESYWKDTEEIFLPLLHMLGLWALRREWVEETVQRLYPKQYVTLQDRLKSNQPDQIKCVQQIQARLDQQTRQTGQVVCELRQLVPGRIIYRSRVGESLEELCETITITIFAPDRSHCYQLLEFIHQFGMPVQGRFVDYIANPNANGYSALHTTVIGNSENLSCNHKLIVFRITTREMHEINMWGLRQTKDAPPGRPPSQLLRWQQTSNLGELLPLLESHDIGAPTKEKEKIYVFTPMGEVKCLNKGSTALDFAYDLHTKIGHHCRTVEVNGQKVSHATELHNGDLVFLKHDPLFKGPDPAWLHIAKNQRTRQKIKQGLRAIRQSIHPGRQHIARYLGALAKDSDFVVPEAQLEKYFAIVVEELGLTDVNSLFQAVMPDPENHGEKVAPEKIIAFILESELTTAVVNQDGHQLVSGKNLRPSFFNPAMQFCPNCKPAPGAPLILHRKKRHNYEKLTLHRKTLSIPKHKESQKEPSLFGLPSPYRITCLNKINPAELDENVQWGEVNLSREASNITILARDRSNLIGDLLKPIYDDNRITLTYLEASADSEGMATVQLTVESDTTKQVESLQGAFDQVPDVFDSSLWPVTLSQSAHYKTRLTGKVEIPYTPGPVREQQMLFGRENEIWQIQNWLEGTNPERLIILAGQRRSGKTSLARLTRSYLRGRIRPIYVDLLQVRRNLTEPNVYWIIMEEIYRAIKSTISADVPEDVYRPPHEKNLQQQPGREFFAYLQRVQDLVYPQRLLLILDEFNILTIEYSNTLLFSELRALTLDSFPGITLMIITHTGQYYDLPPEHEAHALFGQGVKLDLLMLDQLSARKLVQEPLRLILQFNEAVVNQIVDSTNGHPYLINLLCRDIVAHVIQSGRVHVQSEDLRFAVHSLIRNGSNNFHFLIEKVDAKIRPLIVQLAIRQSEGFRWVNLSELENQSRLSATEFNKALVYLEKHGVVSIREHEQTGKTQVRIPIDYFCQWICRNWA